MKLRYKYWLYAFTSAVLLLSCDTSSTVEPVFKDYFIRYYGEDGSQFAADMVITTEGNIIMLGTSVINQRERVYFVRVNAEGTEEVKKELPSTKNEVAQDIEHITSGAHAGKYAVLSNVIKGDSTIIRLRIVDQQGEVSDVFNFENFTHQFAKSVTPLSDGKFFLAGYTTDTEFSTADPNVPGWTDIEDLLLIKLAADGNPEVAGITRVGKSSLGMAVKVFETGVNSFVYTGYTNELTAGESVIAQAEENFIFRGFGQNPTLPSTEIFSGSNALSEIMVQAIRNPVGEIIAIGTQRDAANTPGSRKTYLSRINANATSILAETALSDLPEQGVAIAYSSQVEMLVLSNTISLSDGTTDISIRKVSPNFESLWPEGKVSFGATNRNDTGSAVAELPNGDILILGTMDLGNQRKMTLIKLRPNGKF